MLINNPYKYYHILVFYCIPKTNMTFHNIRCECMQLYTVPTYIGRSDFIVASLAFAFSRICD